MARVANTRKQISVAIPVYKPNIGFLQETLTSVFNCGVDHELLEVIVVNDFSTDDTVSNLIDNYSGSVKYYKNQLSLGIAGNWNRCIELATCEWIHILHQDDLVLPGFYQELLETQRKNGIEAFVSRCFLINDHGNITSVSRLEQEAAGFMEGAPDKVIQTNTIQCPSIVVKKDVYSTIGGFNPGLKYVLDWEMWFRVSLNYQIWYVPKPLVCFRQHSMSETSRVKASGESARDIIKGVSIVSEYAPSFVLKAREYGARHIVNTAIEFLMIRRWKEAAYQLTLASLCLPQVVARLNYLKCWMWCLRIVIKKGLLKIVGQ